MIQDWNAPGLICVRGGLKDYWLLFAALIEER